MKYKIYLDDCRTPIQGKWVVVRTYDEFVNKVNELGLDSIYLISLDHDLGDGAMKELINGNGEINYDNITEKTGLDAAKFLASLSLELRIPLPQITVHSFNPIGSDNIISCINGYLKYCGLEETCHKTSIPFV